jgi:hypothetical protein
MKKGLIKLVLFYLLIRIIDYAPGNVAPVGIILNSIGINSATSVGCNQILPLIIFLSISVFEIVVSSLIST